jgi:hypothetical protein
MNILIILLSGVLLQLLVLYLGLQTIRKHTTIFPNPSMLKVFEKYVPKEWLRQLPPDKVILEALKPKTEGGSRLEKAFTSALDERIVFLKEDKQFTPTFKEIITAINHLLIKKRELFSLDLAQQITNSHIQKNRSSAYLWLPILLAIPFGVTIIGLPSDFEPIMVYLMSIGIFIFGIVIHLRIKNKYEVTYADLEKEKSQFSIFLQTELLPNTSNQSLNTILFVLQQNLETFNERFTTNMEAFHKTVKSLNENHKVQRDFVEKLEKLSLNEIGNFNLQVIERFENVILKMHKFETWFDELNQNTEKSILLAKRLDHLVETAEQMGLDIGNVSKNIDQRLEEANGLLKFLKSHFAELDSRKQLINHAVIDFDEFMKNALEELEAHTTERIESIQEITLKEEDFLIKAFEKNRDALSQLNHLPALNKIDEQMSKMTTQYEKESQYISQGIRSLITKLEAANHNLEILRIEAQKKK